MESNGEPEAYITPDHSVAKCARSTTNSKERFSSSGKSTRMKNAAIKNSSTSADTNVSYQTAYYSSGKSRSGRIQRKAIARTSYDFEDMKLSSKASAKKRAEEFRATLGTEFPSFSKVLVRSSVTVGFCLNLPTRFCKLQLPAYDCSINLEDEIGEVYPVTYIGDRGTLSGGWRTFCCVHDLAEGDIAIFQLVNKLHFKVYIIKKGDSPPVNGGHGASSVSVLSENDINGSSESDRSLSITIGKEETQTNDPTAGSEEMDCVRSIMLMDMDNSAPGDVAPAADAAKSPESPPPRLNGAATLDDFRIVVNDLILDSELSNEQKRKYYELCCSQNAHLHNSLLQSISGKLAAEIIIGTVSIAEAMKTSKVLGSRERYLVWDQTLKGFELLGMNVGFLRSRLCRLVNVAEETEEAMETEYRTIREEEARLKEEIGSLQAKLSQMEDVRRKLYSEMDALRVNAEAAEAHFQQLKDSFSW